MSGLRTAVIGALALAGAAAPAGAQEEALVEELSTISVTGLAATPEGPEPGLLAATTVTGVKTDTPLELVPQSVTVVTSGAMEQRRPQSVEEAIAYAPGVVASPWGRTTASSSSWSVVSTSAPTASTATVSPRRSSASPASRSSPTACSGWKSCAVRTRCSMAKAIRAAS